MDKKRILIVDDEEKFTRIVRLNLERTGWYEVKEENKGKRALSTAREFRPQLILLDVVMPDADGGDVVAQLRSDPELKSIPVVFLTAVVSRREGKDGGVISGGLKFLAKPVSLKTLVDCIEANLEDGQPNKSGGATTAN